MMLSNFYTFTTYSLSLTSDADRFLSFTYQNKPRHILFLILKNIYSVWSFSLVRPTKIKLGCMMETAPAVFSNVRKELYKWHVMLIHSHGHCKRVYLTDLSKTSHFRPTQTGFFGSLGHVCSVPLFCRDHMINTEHSAKVHTQTSHFMSRLQRVWSYKAAAPSAHRSMLNTLHIIYSHLETYYSFLQNTFVTSQH